MINKCNFCDKIENTVYSYLCVECNNNTNYCETCNPVMERIFSRQFFHCVFCNQKKQIKTINFLNNILNADSIINDNSENRIYNSINKSSSYSKITNLDKNKLILNFESKNPIDKKLEFFENLANHLNTNFQSHKMINESLINQALLNDTTNTNFGGISHINANTSKNQKLINSTLLNETSPNLGVHSNNTSNTFNSLLNAFSPIKNKEPSQQRLYGSAVSLSKNLSFLCEIDH